MNISAPWTSEFSMSCLADFLDAQETAEDEGRPAPEIECPACHLYHNRHLPACPSCHR